MMRIEMFFGRSIGERAFVTDAQWRTFARHVLAVNFEHGFTVLHADGNWRDARSGKLRTEKSELVVIVTDDSESTREKVTRVVGAYKRQFRQDAVGIFTIQGCGAF